MCLQSVIQKLSDDNLMDLSVVIPTYNRCDSLRKTLQSVQVQTLDSTRFEVVIADDGSQDQTAEVASESYPFNVQYHRQQNQGSAMARNRLYFIRSHCLGARTAFNTRLEDGRTILSWNLRPRWKHKRQQRDALISGILDFFRGRQGKAQHL